jgi:hypothetical protein
MVGVGRKMLDHRKTHAAARLLSLAEEFDEFGVRAA